MVIVCCVIGHMEPHFRTLFALIQINCMINGYKLLCVSVISLHCLHGRSEAQELHNHDLLMLSISCPLLFIVVQPNRQEMLILAA